MFKYWRFVSVPYQAPKTGRIILCDLDLVKSDLDLVMGPAFTSGHQFQHTDGPICKLRSLAQTGQCFTMGKEANDDIEPGMKEFKVSVVDIEECISRPPRKPRRQQLAANLRRLLDFRNKSDPSPWPQLVRRLIYLFSAALLLAIFAVM